MNDNSNPPPGGKPALITPSKSIVNNRPATSNVHPGAPTSSLSDLTDSPCKAGFSSNSDDQKSQNLNDDVANYSV